MSCTKELQKMMESKLKVVGSEEVPRLRKKRKAEKNDKQDEIDLLMQKIDSDAEEIIAELPGDLVALENFKVDTFGLVSYESVLEAMSNNHCAKEKLLKGSLNTFVSDLSNLVCCEVQTLHDKLCKLIRWIHKRTPKEEDGNNFGVEVQSHLLGRMEEDQKCLEHILEESKTYHLARIEVLRKFELDHEITEIEGATFKDCKKTQMDKNSASRSVKRTSNQIYMEDLCVFIAKMDAGHYLRLRQNVEECTNIVMFVWTYLKHNYEKVAFPRGREEARNCHMY